MNTPFGNSITTAEHAIAMMFAVARQIPEPTPRPRPASGRSRASWASRLTGKTLGVIGAGNIGGHRLRPRAGPRR
jgi:D-3-phosphoglycerate dehydrogenase